MLSISPDIVKHFDTDLEKRRFLSLSAPRSFGVLRYVCAGQPLQRMVRQPPLSSLALYQDQVPVRHDRREKLREFLDGLDGSALLITSVGVDGSGAKTLRDLGQTQTGALSGAAKKKGGERT